MNESSPKRDGGPERDPLQRVAGLLARLPGIGEKSALRLALALVRADAQYLAALAESIRELHGALRICAVCCDFSPDDVCPRCGDARRDRTLVCVVAQPQDRMAIERTGVFRGLYHVLHGVLDPLAGVGPAQLRVDALLQRLARRDDAPAVEEVIVATSPNVEGDATALYLGRLISPLGVKVTRIASGVAVGGELEYADMTTLHRALEDRREL
jgi:recombination protein RecR